MWHWPVLSFLLVLFFARNCGAQVVDPVTSAQAPVPGVGHDYIGMGTETVNPADLYMFVSHSPKMLSS
jgi:hypothetical protein